MGSAGDEGMLSFGSSCGTSGGEGRGWMTGEIVDFDLGVFFFSCPFSGYPNLRPLGSKLFLLQVGSPAIVWLREYSIHPVWRVSWLGFSDPGVPS